MRHSQRRTLAAVVAALLSAAAWAWLPAGAQRRPGAGVDVYAITNARVVTVSGSTIERGTVVIRDGLIAAVGANVSAPPDARTIDGTGLTVYPGLIDASTSLAIPRPTPAPAPAGGGGGGGLAGLFGQTAPSAVSPNSTQPPGLQPEILAADIIRPGGPEVEAARNAGITTAQTAPRGNIFLGQSAVINLAGDTPQQMIVRTPVALYVGLNPIGQGNYPGSLMGVFSSVRQMLLDARRFREANEIYERNPRGLRRPEQDKSLAALLPVLARQMPVVMQADRVREIERALRPRAGVQPQPRHQRRPRSRPRRRAPEGGERARPALSELPAPHGRRLSGGRPRDFAHPARARRGAEDRRPARRRGRPLRLPVGRHDDDERLPRQRRARRRGGALARRRRQGFDVETGGDSRRLEPARLNRGRQDREPDGDARRPVR